MAEYEDVLKAAQMLTTLGAKEVIIFTDSQLIAQQILGKFEIKEERMQRYVREIREAIVKFSTFTLEQISRDENGEVDALTRLASSVEEVRG